VYVHRKGVPLKTVRTPDRLRRVPNQPGTQHRSVRISDGDWDDAEQATASMNTDRAKVINQFLRWYLRRPGVKLPERPPVKPR
jgi:hypothetical protein